MDTCLNCFRPYRKRSARTRFCSRECDRAQYRFMQRLARGLAECPSCGEKFWPEGQRRVFCSGTCARKLRSRRGAVRRLTILERDGWVCGLCDEPIDPDLDYPDPWCGTADHIIPLGRGGPDSPENIQAAHWACNYAKGDAILDG